jgi:hypothetical protein
MRLVTPPACATLHQDFTEGDQRITVDEVLQLRAAIRSVASLIGIGHALRQQRQ